MLRPDCITFLELISIQLRQCPFRISVRRIMGENYSRRLLFEIHLVDVRLSAGLVPVWPVKFFTLPIATLSHIPFHTIIALHAQYKIMTNYSI